MHIPVNLSIQPSSPTTPLPPQLVKLNSNDVAIIELQGALVVDGDDPTTGLSVGTLHLDPNDKATLRIGAQSLEGKLVSLPKPLALLVRQRRSLDDGDGDAEDVEYNAVALVKKKLVFSKRPMPIPNARPA
ncbi:hypothetical protein EXIGLDRAFT_672838 [Exidia glandulosa HHB12029]|uniref:Ctf8-domain-containing protein n=1 Tax=Exidia glandulosa HHB12029 TaxID=1314781 RepID=A0A165JEC0_EXIGL|nr:hypothetical protein EXIGLDRAFT_672838 [Exidia glandulosa HHB12029]